MKLIPLTIAALAVALTAAGQDGSTNPNCPYSTGCTTTILGTAETTLVNLPQYSAWQAQSGCAGATAGPTPGNSVYGTINTGVTCKDPTGVGGVPQAWQFTWSEQYPGYGDPVTLGAYGACVGVYYSYSLASLVPPATPVAYVPYHWAFDYEVNDVTVSCGNSVTFGIVNSTTISGSMGAAPISASVGATLQYNTSYSTQYCQKGASPPASRGADSCNDLTYTYYVMCPDISTWNGNGCVCPANKHFNSSLTMCMDNCN